MNNSHIIWIACRGDVQVASITDNIVYLELLGACGSCSSSTMTMKLGLEKHLKNRFRQIKEVRQGSASAPLLTLEEVEKVLEGIRPFLSITGAEIEAVSVGEGILQPTVTLKLINLTIAIDSIRTEVVQRIKKHFGIPIRVEWL